MRSPIEYIKQAIALYTKKENFVFFAKIIAILTLVSFVFEYLQKYLHGFVIDDIGMIKSESVSLLVLYIILLVLAGLFAVYVSLTKTISLLNLNSKIKDVFKAGLGKYPKYLGAFLILSLINIFGTVLLIIPGIIFSVWFNFTLFLMLDKNLGFKEALKQSRKMVMGRFWKVLGRYLIFGIFYILVSLPLFYIPYVGSFLVSLIAPLTMLPNFLLYKDLAFD